jgi:hypothetical protein
LEAVKRAFKSMLQPQSEQVTDALDLIDFSHELHCAILAWNRSSDKVCNPEDKISASVLTNVTFSPLAFRVRLLD